jgi:hypothetical protein
VFFNGVVHALKGSKVHQDDDEAIYVPAKTLAFLVLAVGGPLHLSLAPKKNMLDCFGGVLLQCNGVF